MSESNGDADEPSNDKEQMRIDDYGGKRLLTDGGRDTESDTMSDSTNNDDDGSDDGEPKLDFTGTNGFGATADPELPGDLTSDDGDVLDDDGSLLGLDKYVGVDELPAIDPVVRSYAVEEDLLDKPQHASLYHLPSRSDACHCGAWEAVDADADPSDVDCSCEADEDGRPIRWEVADRATILEAIDEFEADGDGRATIYGVVLDRSESPHEMDTRVTVTVADTTGVTTLQAMGDASLSTGDEVVVTDVARGSDEDLGELTITTDTHVETVTSGELRADDCVIERSELNRAPDVFKSNESVTAARNWMADVLIEEEHIETPYGDDDMMMYVDDESHPDHGLFVANAEDRIKEILDEYLPPERCNSQNKGQIVSLIRDRTRVAADAHEPGAPEAEARRWSVTVANGVIDLRTGKLHDHDPAWRSTSKLPVEYHPDEYDTLGDKWDDFLASITRDPEDKRTVLYMIAHSICRTYPAEAIFCGIGPGDNGKTTLTEAIKGLLGESEIGSWSMSMLCGEYDFGGGPFVGNRLAIDDDATSVKVHDFTPLKRLSGGSDTQINIKEVPVGGYDNYATAVYWSNDPPLTGDKTDGAKRRIYPIIMTTDFVDNPDPDDPDQQKKRPKEEVLEELHRDDELEALLVVAARLAGEMHDDTEMRVGRSQEERWDIYQQYSDSIMQFWTDVMTESRGTRVPVSVIYEIYVRWCDANGIDPVSNKGRTNFWALSDQCPVISYKRNDVWTDGERAVEHVALTDEAMKYAPQWIKEQWGESTESPGEDNPSLANRLDRVTPIGDLKDTGVQTVEGRVKSRSQYPTTNGSAIQLRIEDATHGIGVVEYVSAEYAETDPDEIEAVLDGVVEGDKIHLDRAILKDNNGEMMLHIDPGYTTLTVAEHGALKAVDDRIEAEADADVEDEQDGDEASNDDGDGYDDEYDDARYTIKQVVEAAKIRGGGVQDPRAEWVVDEATDKLGVDESTVERHIERMKRNGDLYEPDDGHYRTTGSVEVDDDVIDDPEVAD